MVVSTQELTRGLSCAGVGVSGVEGYKDDGVRAQALSTPVEPLNATTRLTAGLSLPCSLDGHSTLTGGPVIGRVPVVSANGKPLMPCRSSKARKLLAKNLAEKCWSKLGIFYLRLKFNPKSEPNRDQQVCLAVDTGSKWDGIAVVSKKEILTCGMLVLPLKVAEKLEQRNRMRRARRYRKTPRRINRFDNRRRPNGWIAPSQKAKVDFRIKIIDELSRLYFVDRFAVEDVGFKHCRKRKGKYFSTVEIGKTKFYEYLRKLGKLALYTGVETSKLREKFGLPKDPNKKQLSWDTHAVDAIAFGCADIGCTDPYPPEFWVWKRFEHARRQLHRLEPSKGGTRKRYGGSWSIPPFKKGDVVLWHGKLARVGGFMDGRISLHSFGLKNKRFTQGADPNESTRLFNQRVLNRLEKPQFLPPINGMGLFEVG